MLTLVGVSTGDIAGGAHSGTSFVAVSCKAEVSGACIIVGDTTNGRFVPGAVSVSPVLGDVPSGVWCSARVLFPSGGDKLFAVACKSAGAVIRTAKTDAVAVGSAVFSLILPMMTLTADLVGGWEMSKADPSRMTTAACTIIRVVGAGVGVT